MKKRLGVHVCLVAVVVLLAAEVHRSAAATCNPNELTPCGAAITSGSGKPSGECCSKLKSQVSCFCGYLKVPALKMYVSSPNAKNLVKACGAAIPKC